MEFFFKFMCYQPARCFQLIFMENICYRLESRRTGRDDLNLAKPRNSGTQSFNPARAKLPLTLAHHASTGGTDRKKSRKFYTCNPDRRLHSEVPPRQLLLNGDRLHLSPALLCYSHNSSAWTPAKGK